MLFTPKVICQKVKVIEFEYPESYLDISSDVGRNHRIYGLKAVLGTIGTGFSGSIGRFDNFTSFN